MNRSGVIMVAALAWAVAGGAAPAQAPDCNGRGAAGSWIGGDAAGSDVAVAPGALTRVAASVPQNGDVVTLFALGTHRRPSGSRRAPAPRAATR
jgi:hypothetical protein